MDRFNFSIDKEVIVHKFINPPLTNDEKFDAWFCSAISSLKDGNHWIQYSEETHLNVTVGTKSVTVNNEI